MENEFRGWRQVALGFCFWRAHSVTCWGENTKKPSLSRGRRVGRYDLSRGRRVGRYDKTPRL